MYNDARLVDDTTLVTAVHLLALHIYCLIVSDFALIQLTISAGKNVLVKFTGGTRERK